jgi:hypothetical protein
MLIHSQLLNHFFKNRFATKYIMESKLWLTNSTVLPPACRNIPSCQSLFWNLAHHANTSSMIKIRALGMRLRQTPIARSFQSYIAYRVSITLTTREGNDFVYFEAISFGHPRMAPFRNMFLPCHFTVKTRPFFKDATTRKLDTRL